MSKRSSRHKSRPAREPGRNPAPVNLEKYLNRADNLIRHNRGQDVIELLEPLLVSHPTVAEVHYYLGYARGLIGDLWGGVTGYERGLELHPDPIQWLALASLYLELGLRALPLHAFRQAIRLRPDVETVEDIRAAMDRLQEEIRDLATSLKLDADRVEKGLRYMEEGQREFGQGNYAASVAANRRAIRFLGDWPPPRNNLSQALFFDGQPEESLAAAQQVLREQPDNVHALGNAIRVLAWTGRGQEARALGERLFRRLPQNSDERLKAAEAAAILDDDQQVYDLLRPLEGKSELQAALDLRARRFLAVAEANLGKRSARQRWQALLPAMPVAERFLEAIKDRRPGLGWADRFPYFSIAELMPIEQQETFAKLMGRRDEIPSRQFEAERARFVRRFPQFVLVAEKMIWEEMHPEIGIELLAAMGTPAADAALRRFGLSQAGDDDSRMRALTTLMESGALSPEEPLRLWLDGEWRDVVIQRQTIGDQPGPGYAPKVAELLNRGGLAFQQGREEEAARMYQQALELDPEAREAYNNLATVYARRGDHVKAKELWHAALEIDPLYVFPLCNLAVYLLDDDDIDGASELIRPLASVEHFSPQEMGYYSYIQARILIAREEFTAAENLLQRALEVWPGYDLAQDLLERLRRFVSERQSWELWQKEQQERDRKWRARLQAKLTTRAPSLREALPLYSKEALTAMARVVVRWGGWSTLRKAELIELIVEELVDPDNLQLLSGYLADDERDALREVVRRGGYMPWSEFDASHGNDLDESRFWQYNEPETTMGLLRMLGLLVETTFDGELLIAVPQELRSPLTDLLL